MADCGFVGIFITSIFFPLTALFICSSVVCFSLAHTGPGFSGVVCCFGLATAA